MERWPNTLMTPVLMVVLAIATVLNALSGIALFTAALGSGHFIHDVVAFYRQWICEPFIAFFLFALPGTWPVLPWWVLDYFFLTSGLMLAINIVEYLGTGTSSLGIVFRKEKTGSNAMNFIERCFFAAAFFLSSFFILPLSLAVLIADRAGEKDRNALAVLRYCIALLIVSATVSLIGKFAFPAG